MFARIPRRSPIWICAALLTMAAASASTQTVEAAPAADAETPDTALISPDGRHIAYGQIAVAANGEQRVRIIVGEADGSNRRPLPIDAEGVDEVQWYGNDRLAY